MKDLLTLKRKDLVQKAQDIGVDANTYNASVNSQIRKAIWGVKDEIIGEIDTTDTDGDGLYDIYETAGMIIPNGQVIYTDPNDPDSDDDGLDDDKEMGIPEKNISSQMIMR